MKAIIVIVLFLMCDQTYSLRQNSGDVTRSEPEKQRAKKVLLQDNYYEIVDRLNNLTARLTDMEHKTTKPHRVAFKAHLAKPMSPAQNQLIVFDDVRFNVGQAYHHGTFIAPYNGTYLFAVTMCSGGGHHIIVDILRNGTMIGQVLAGDPTYSDCASESTVTELSAGDDVIVQHRGTHGNYIHGSQDIHSSFTGVLLY